MWFEALVLVGEIIVFGTMLVLFGAMLITVWGNAICDVKLRYIRHLSEHARRIADEIGKK